MMRPFANTHVSIHAAIHTLAAALALIAALAAALVFAPAAGAQTDVRLRITAEGRSAIRIGFLEPEKEIDEDMAGYHEEFLRILKDDLEMSGYFEIVKDPEKDEPHALVGAVTESRSRELSFDVNLQDRVSSQSIFRRKYAGATDGIAMVAHVVADDIVYALTGRQGIANTQMAFVAGARGEASLYTVHIDGSGLSRITQTPSIVMSPSWSPDATRIAYVSYASGDPAIYVIDLEDKTTVRFSAFEGMNAMPAWSPDGSKIALTLSKDGNPEVYVISIDGKTRKRLTRYSGIDCSPTWAPNGFELAFTTDRTGSPQIYAVDMEGLSPRRITHEGGYNTSPAWSPEGDLIAYVARIDGGFQICTVDPFGITTSVLTEKGDNEYPSWSPDGMHIIYSSHARSKSGIYIMNRDGSGKRRIFKDLENPRSPAWSAQPRKAKLEPLED
jgi:TolB protein